METKLKQEARKIKFIEKKQKKGDRSFCLERDTVVKAVMGDSESLQTVVDFYKPMIEGYSRRPRYDEYGDLQYEIDEDVKRSIEIALIVAIMKYKI